MGIASAIGSFAANQVGDTIKERIFGGTPHDSWTDFYIAMALDMERVVVRKKVSKIARKVIVASDPDADEAETITNIFDNYSFAKSLTDEYDKAVRGGKTIIGGMPIMWGNKPLMLVTLLGIMQAQSVSKNGDLLRDIGPAIQAYWTPAFTTIYETPSIPCIGTIKNIQTIVGLNVTPGIWTPIQIPAMGNVQPFLLNFIASAALHLLTLTGIITCLAQYPPPAPPAPGVLPWIGYFVNPVAIGSGSSLTQKLKNTLKKNVKSIIDEIATKDNLIALGEIAVSKAIEDVILGKEIGVNEVVAQVITDVAGGLVEGGKLQTSDIEKNVKDSLIATEDETANLIGSKPAPPNESYINAGG